MRTDAVDGESAVLSGLSRFTFMMHHLISAGTSQSKDQIALLLLLLLSVLAAGVIRTFTLDPTSGITPVGGVGEVCSSPRCSC